MLTCDTTKLCEQYMQLIYRDLHKQNKSVATTRKSIPETYGEILPEGVSRLLSVLPLTEQDVFVDLGSGMGKIVLQVFLQSRIKASCGIEVLPALHGLAIQVATRVQAELPEFYEHGRQLQFLSGSFFDISFPFATVLLIGSPCFSPSMLDALGRIINNMPNVHTVLALRPLTTLSRISFKKAIQIECSWDSALCYIYSAKAQ